MMTTKGLKREIPEIKGNCVHNEIFTGGHQTSQLQIKDITLGGDIHSHTELYEIIRDYSQTFVVSLCAARGKKYADTAFRLVNALINRSMWEIMEYTQDYATLFGSTQFPRVKRWLWPIPFEVLRQYEDAAMQKGIIKKADEIHKCWVLAVEPPYGTMHEIVVDQVNYVWQAVCVHKRQEYFPRILPLVRYSPLAEFSTKTTSEDRRQKKEGSEDFKERMAKATQATEDLRNYAQSHDIPFDEMATQIDLMQRLPEGNHDDIRVDDLVDQVLRIWEGYRIESRETADMLETLKEVAQGKGKEKIDKEPVKPEKFDHVDLGESDQVEKTSIPEKLQQKLRASKLKIVKVLGKKEKEPEKEKETETKESAEEPETERTIWRVRVDNGPEELGDLDPKSIDTSYVSKLSPGETIAKKMGYQPGKGLGLHEQGVTGIPHDLDITAETAQMRGREGLGLPTLQVISAADSRRAISAGLPIGQVLFYTARGDQCYWFMSKQLAYKINATPFAEKLPYGTEWKLHTHNRCIRVLWKAVQREVGEPELVIEFKDVANYTVGMVRREENSNARVLNHVLNVPCSHEGPGDELYLEPFEEPPKRGFLGRWANSIKESYQAAKMSRVQKTKKQQATAGFLILSLAFVAVFPTSIWLGFFGSFMQYCGIGALIYAPIATAVAFLPNFVKELQEPEYRHARILGRTMQSLFGVVTFTLRPLGWVWLTSYNAVRPLWHAIMAATWMTRNRLVIVAFAIATVTAFGALGTYYIRKRRANQFTKEGFADKKEKGTLELMKSISSCGLIPKFMFDALHLAKFVSDQRAMTFLITGWNVWFSPANIYDKPEDLIWVYYWHGKGDNRVWAKTQIAARKMAPADLHRYHKMRAGYVNSDFTGNTQPKLVSTGDPMRIKDHHSQIDVILAEDMPMIWANAVVKVLPLGATLHTVQMQKEGEDDIVEGDVDEPEERGVSLEDVNWSDDSLPPSRFADLKKKIADRTYFHYYWINLKNWCKERPAVYWVLPVVVVLAVGSFWWIARKVRKNKRKRAYGNEGALYDKDAESFQPQKYAIHVLNPTTGDLELKTFMWKGWDEARERLRPLYPSEKTINITQVDAAGHVRPAVVKVRMLHEGNVFQQQKEQFALEGVIKTAGDCTHVLPVHDRKTKEALCLMHRVADSLVTTEHQLEDLYKHSVKTFENQFIIGEPGQATTLNLANYVDTDGKFTDKVRKIGKDMVALTMQKNHSSFKPVSHVPMKDRETKRMWFLGKRVNPVDERFYIPYVTQVDVTRKGSLLEYEMPHEHRICSSTICHDSLGTRVAGLHTMGSRDSDLCIASAIVVPYEEVPGRLNVSVPALSGSTTA